MYPIYTDIAVTIVRVHGCRIFESVDVDQVSLWLQITTRRLFRGWVPVAWGPSIQVWRGQRGSLYGDWRGSPTAHVWPDPGTCHMEISIWTDRMTDRQTWVKTLPSPLHCPAVKIECKRYGWSWRRHIPESGELTGDSPRSLYQWEEWIQRRYISLCPEPQCRQDESRLACSTSSLQETKRKMTSWCYFWCWLTMEWWCFVVPLVTILP